ncbi:MAG: hypothetical protein RIE53_05855 [Rhodothermales bacterium]
MRVFRSVICTAILSPLLAIGLLVGGGLIPNLHDALHHPADHEQESSAHCPHHEHQTAFERHHSSVDHTQCVFHQRTTTSLGPSAIPFTVPSGMRNEVHADSGRLQGQDRGNGLRTRGPPVNQGV